MIFNFVLKETFTGLFSDALTTLIFLGLCCITFICSVLHYQSLLYHQKLQVCLNLFIKKKKFDLIASSVAQSYLTLCNPMDCSLPCSSVCGIFQARILEQVAVSSSRGSSNPETESASPASPSLAGQFFTTEPPGKPPMILLPHQIIRDIFFV